MKRSNFFKNSIFTLLPISLGLTVLFGVKSHSVNEVEAYSGTSLSTQDIDLNDTSSTDIRTYYSGLNSLSDNEKQGTNLLKNLKPILMNNQKYYNYDSGDNVWKLYEIADRDWVKSPASSAPNATYDSANNILRNYTFQYSTGNDAGNPYLHALYVNRDANNLKRAWGDHGNRNSEATIEREHIWPKSHGFNETTGVSGGARGDPMHLWAADGTANGNHSNYFYGYVDKTKSFTDSGVKFSSISGNLVGFSKTIGGSLKVFEPQDSDKGDIARACFYMVARYNNYANATSGIDVNNPNLYLSDNNNERTGTSSYNDPYDLGILTDLLEWNRIDPPDEFEIHRNNLLYTNFTNNRNPFIDFPQWADICFGNSTSVADPASDSINGQETEKSLVNISITCEPAKTLYTVGESFSTKGMIVTAEYSDNSTEVINDYTYAPTGALSLSNDTITVSYEGKSAELSINVVPSGTRILRYFEKVNSNLTSGNYLISCDEAGAVWKTGASGSTNVISYSLDENNHIPYTQELNNALFTFNMNDGSIFAPNQKYIYNDEFTTEVKISTNPESNTVSLSNGTLLIVGSGGSTLWCNTSSNPTFNYYKSTSSAYKSLNAYRLVESVEILPTSVTVSPSSCTLEVGETQNLTASVLPLDAYNKSVTWSTSDSSVATVDNNGHVVAVASGQATITATSNSLTSICGTCTITVPEHIVLSSIEISGSYSTSFFVGDEFDSTGLITTAYYSNGNSKVVTPTDISGYDMSEPGNQTVTVTYTEDDVTVYDDYNIEISEIIPVSLGISGNFQKIFNVNDTFTHDGLVAHVVFNNGSENDVTPIVSTPDMSSKGKKPVTVSYTQNNVTVSTSYEITVNAIVHSVSLNNTSISVDMHDSVKKTLIATVDADTGAEYSLNWSVADNNVLELVQNGNSVQINPLEPGSTSVTVSAGGKTASCTVAVTSLVSGVTISGDNTIEAGKTLDLTATVSPSDAVNKGLTWTSSNSSILSVVQNGDRATVTALGTAGQSATITATAKDGTGKYDSITITIIAIQSIEIDYDGINNDNKVPFAKYKNNESVDAKVTAIWSNGNTTDITEDATNNFKINGLVLGEQKITASYKGLNAELILKITNEGSSAYVGWNSNKVTRAGSTFNATPLQQAEAWADYFISKTGGGEHQGPCKLPADQRKRALEAIWDDLNAEYGFMTDDSKDEFCNESATSIKITEAMNHYKHICKQYSLDQFVEDSQQNRPLINNSPSFFKTTLGISTIGIVAFVILGAILTIVFVSFRKHKRRGV